MASTDPLASKVRWLIRDMCQDDLLAVELTEQAAYEFPWDIGIFEDCLQFSNPSWVAETQQGEVVGHAVMNLAVGEAHILNVCVHPHYQGMGLGRILLKTLVEHADGEAVKSMFLEVRASNAAALALYQSAGFSQVGLRRGYYPGDDAREDAVVLSLEL